MIATKKRHTAFDAWVKRTIDDLWNTMENPPPKPLVIVGVYILSNDGLCVYVGQSRNVHARLEAHRKMRVIAFDKVEILECREDQLTDLENQYLTELTPVLNRIRPACNF